jgi:DNA (cytosine-5)-methyltransferase 1
MLTTPYVKSRRAQSEDDEETWVEDAPAPTLNRMDNTGESRATVLAVIQDARGMDKGQNGVGVSESDTAYTLDRVSEQGVAVAYSIREDAKADNFSATQIDTARALQALQPGIQSHHAQTFIAQDVEQESRSVVRRLTPTECERLQGFPDGWTAQRWDWKKECLVDQADSSRYKQLGNAVAVPVVSWIAERLVLVAERMADDRE